MKIVESQNDLESVRRLNVSNSLQRACMLRDMTDDPTLSKSDWVTTRAASFGEFYKRKDKNDALYTAFYAAKSNEDREKLVRSWLEEWVKENPRDKKLTSENPPRAA